MAAFFIVLYWNCIFEICYVKKAKQYKRNLKNSFKVEILKQLKFFWVQYWLCSLWKLLHKNDMKGIWRIVSKFQYFSNFFQRINNWKKDNRRIHLPFFKSFDFELFKDRIRIQRLIEYGKRLIYETNQQINI